MGQVKELGGMVQNANRRSSTHEHAVNQLLYSLAGIFHLLGFPRQQAPPFTRSIIPPLLELYSCPRLTLNLLDHVTPLPNYYSHRRPRHCNLQNVSFVKHGSTHTSMGTKDGGVILCFRVNNSD